MSSTDITHCTGRILTASGVEICSIRDGCGRFIKNNLPDDPKIRDPYASFMDGLYENGNCDYFIAENQPNS